MTIFHMVNKWDSATALAAAVECIDNKIITLVIERIIGVFYTICLYYLKVFVAPA